MLCDPVESIKGVGEKTATLFHKEGIFTKEDILLSFPLSYLSYPEISSIKEAKEKEWMAFYVVCCGGVLIVNLILMMIFVAKNIRK